MVGVCTIVSVQGNVDLVNAHTGEVEIYRPLSFSWGEDLSRGLNTVLPVKVIELESRRKFKSWWGLS
jgi:hypothetical protein